MYSIVLATLAGGLNTQYVLFQGSQEENKKMNKRIKIGEHRKRIDGIMLAALARGRNPDIRLISRYVLFQGSQ